MRNYFPYKEFVECSNIPKDHLLTYRESKSMQFWQSTLNPIRDILGFPIALTDWLRIHKGELSKSQHYANEPFSYAGAVDLLPVNVNNKEHFVSLALMLMAHPQIKRVCWYEPSNRFSHGGFHCDAKGSDNVLFINAGEAIDWKQCNQSQLVESVLKSK